MAMLRVVGGQPLAGTIDVEGNKNAALPLIAACLLTGETCVLDNVPRIRDVDVLLDILAGLGGQVIGRGESRVTITCADVTSDEPDRALVGRVRGSVLLMGPMLARRQRVVFAPPGGDFPTRRTIHTHLLALEAFGVRISESADGHVLDAPRGLIPASIYLDEASVTGTETAILAAAAAAGTSEIRHAACEPHVAELCRFLGEMGIDIEGAGTSTVRVTGKAAPRGATHRLDGDYIEAGSWAVVGAVTKSRLTVRGARPEDLEPIVSVMQRMQVDCEIGAHGLAVRPSTPVAIRRITTGLWPGFPSDLVSLITVLATQASGRTLIHDWMYELRLFALEQMSGMQADLFLCDPHRIVVTGPRRLRGRVLDSRDIRSGMSLIAAALAADGESRILSVEIVERGYARLVERLRALGADVSRAGDD